MRPARWPLRRPPSRATPRRCRSWRSRPRAHLRRSPIDRPARVEVRSGGGASAAGRDRGFQQEVTRLFGSRTVTIAMAVLLAAAPAGAQPADPPPAPKPAADPPDKKPRTVEDRIEALE